MIKTYIISILLLINGCFLYSQQNIRINQTNNKWSHSINRIRLGPNGYNYWESYSYVIQDSIQINNSYVHPLYYYSDSLQTNGKISRYIKQLGDEVFFSDSITTIKVFDFGLEKNDSVIIPTNYIPQNEEFVPDSILAVVDSVAQQVYNNSVELKTIYLQIIPFLNGTIDKDNIGGDIWIEGIGSLINGLNHLGYYKNFYRTANDDRFYFSCFHANNELVYQHPDLSTCYINTTAISEMIVYPDLIKIYSTSNGTICVTLENSDFGNLQLYNLFGKEVFSAHIFECKTEVPFSDNGTFIYRFTNNKNRIQTGKVSLF